jgi:hypothetical protein
MNEIDPVSEFTVSINDEWCKFFAFNNMPVPSQRLFYKFIRFIQYDIDQENVKAHEINNIMSYKFSEFLDYLIGV